MKHLLFTLLFGIFTNGWCQCIGAGGIGDFEGIQYNDWNTLTPAGGVDVGMFTQESKLAHSGTGSLKINVVSDHNWGMRTYPSCNTTLVKGRFYKIRFWVYGGNRKQIKVALQQQDVTTVVITEQLINLVSDEWQVYEVVMQSDDNYINGKVKFTFPSIGVYYLDDVVVTETQDQVTKIVQPNDINLRYTGVVYNNITETEATFYRFPFSYATENESNTSPFVQVKTAKTAAASTGISIEFKTNSKIIKAKFSELTTLTKGVYTLDFAVYKNGALYDVFTDTDEEIEFSLSDLSGVNNIWRITMPSFAQIKFLGLEIDQSANLQTLSEDNRPIYVAIGNSITHGMGQTNLSTHLTYPWLVADSLNFHLYNWGTGGSKVHESVFENFAASKLTPDVVTVLWGYNDINCAHVNCNTDEYIINYTLVFYESLMTNLASTYPNATIIGILPTYSSTPDKSTVRSLGYLRTKQELIIKELKSSYDNISFFNGNDVTDVGSLNDDVHLNDLGAEQVANRIIKELYDLEIVYKSNIDTLALRSEYEDINDVVLDIDDELEGRQTYNIISGNEANYYSINSVSGIVSIAKPIPDVVDDVHHDLLVVTIGTTTYNLTIVDGFDYFISENPEYTVLNSHQDIVNETGNEYTPYNNIWGKGSAINRVDFRMATLVHHDNPDSTVFIWDTPSKASEFGGPSVWSYQNIFWGERYNLREGIGGFPVKIGDIASFEMEFNYEQLFGTETYKVALNHFLNQENYISPFTENDGDLFMVFDQVGNYVPAYANHLNDTVIGAQEYILLHDSTGNIQNNTPEGYQLRRAIIKNDGQFKKGVLNLKSLYNSFSSRGFLDQELYFSHIQFGIEITEGWGAVRVNKFNMNLEKEVANEINNTPKAYILSSHDTGVLVDDNVLITFGGVDLDEDALTTTISLDGIEQLITSPYNWMATVGMHTFKVTVDDSKGGVDVESIVLEVVDIINSQSIIIFNSVVDGETIETGLVVINVSATDYEGVESVKLLITNINSTTISIDLTDKKDGTFEADWSVDLIGTYTLAIVVTDELGEITNSLPITVIVVGTGLPTSIDFALENPAITIYPNPTSEALFIDGKLEDLPYLLYDNDGLLLFKGDYSNTGIDVSYLSVGIYLIEVDGHIFRVFKK
jgi:lysophospholipase L1-like esterase